MNKEEARQILAQELKFFNDIEYLELTHRVGENRAYEKIAPNGCSYQVEVSIVWDSEPQQVIRIIGSVDDGGLSAFIL